MTLVRREALIVLGMHRSGTSAMGGGLQRLGVDFGENLMPSMEGVNEKGFYEHLGIVELHEELLSSIGYQWSDVRPIPSDVWLKPEVLSIQKKLFELLKSDFDGSNFWGVKDPRMCRLLPIWLPLLHDLQVESKFVIVLRHPREVIDSLKKRDGLDANGAYICWLWYVLEAERQTRKMPRVFVFYEDLLNDWGKVVSTISEQLSVEWPVSPSEVSSEINAFLDVGLRHNKHAGQSTEEGVGTLADELYTAFRNYDFSRVNGLYERFREELDKLAPYLDSINVVQQLRESNTHCFQALKAEKLNAEEQISYRDALVSDLKEQLKAEKLNAEEQISYRDALLDEKDKLLGSRKTLVKLLFLSLRRRAS